MRALLKQAENQRWSDQNGIRIQPDDRNACQLLEAVEAAQQARGNLGVPLQSSAGLKAAAVSHFSVIFEKPPVAFEAQNIGVKSLIIQAEFEITRNSTTTLSAVAKHLSAQMDQEATENGEMR